MNAWLMGLGTASPPHSIPQPAAAEMAASLCAVAPAGERTLHALYRRSAVHSRASVLLSNGLPNNGVHQSFFAPATSSEDRGPGTGARLDRYNEDAPGLAQRAAAAALSEAQTTPDRITHLITVSCTGFAAPGVDAGLIAGLGLRPTVARTHIGFMGCHGAINGLRVAAAFANADPGARILLCAVELCSLHFHYTSDPDKMVANALFADGAAAAIIGAPDRSSKPLAHIAGCGSCLFPGSSDYMTWRIGDHGFEMTLSPRVPDLLARHLKPWLSEFLGAYDLTIGDVAAWAVHPGGPRVLSGVADSLGLLAAALEPSRTVLAEHGNMSSPTVLFIADRIRRSTGPVPGPCVCLAFGPGLVAEAALLI